MALCICLLLLYNSQINRLPGLPFYSFSPCPSQTLIASSDLSWTSSLSSTAELAEGDAAHGRRPPVGAAASHEGGAIPWTSSLDTPRLSDGQPPVLCILLPFPSLSFLSAEPHAPPNCASPLQVRPSLIWMARATYSGLAQEYPSKCTVFPARLPRAFPSPDFSGGLPLSSSCCVSHAKFTAFSHSTVHGGILSALGHAGDATAPVSVLLATLHATGSIASHHRC